MDLLNAPLLLPLSLPTPALEKRRAEFQRMEEERLEEERLEEERKEAELAQWR